MLTQNIDTLPGGLVGLKIKFSGFLNFGDKLPRELRIQQDLQNLTHSINTSEFHSC